MEHDSGGETAGARGNGGHAARRRTEWAKALSESAIYHRAYDGHSDRLVRGTWSKRSVRRRAVEDTEPRTVLFQMTERY